MKMITKEIWNGWKVENLVGEGSFGKVYKITREDFGHTYVAALKVIEIPYNQSEIKAIKSEGLTDESVTTYFKSMVEDIVDEFSLMSKLKGNTNIVSYEDHMVTPKKGEFGWDIYIRMELLNPLLDYVENSGMTIGNVIKLGIDICNALEVCKRYNIIHRDIKPENIFVSNIGSFKLGDFGIARQLEKTMSGLSKKGTYTYMAPEVYKGMPYNSSVDLYSLGIVMYRFLNNNRSPFMPPITEQIKFSDREEANLRRFSGEQLPKPCNATDTLSAIVLKACSYNPEERYSSPEAMKEALQNILDTEKPSVLDSCVIEKTVSSNIDNEDTPISFNNSSHNNSNWKGEEPTEFMAVQPEPSGSYLNDDERTVFMINEEEKNPEQDNEESPVHETVLKLRENEENKKNKISKGKIGIIVLIVAFVTMLIISFFIIFYKNDSSDKTEETTVETVFVPNIVGKSISEATALLDNYGLKLNVSEENYSDEVDSGLIISQSSEKNEVPVGSTIEVVLSRGKELVQVPYVLGMGRSEAKSQLKDLGFAVRISKEYSDIYTKGHVIEQSINSGTELRKGSTITITVSKGTQPNEDYNIDNSVYTYSNYDTDNSNNNSSRNITTNSNENSKKEQSTKNIVKKIGNYKESNALSLSKINVLRESLNLSGSQNSEYTNLARYMANNRMGNASSTYYQLTNVSKNLKQKIYSLSIASSSNEDILEAATKITDKILTSKYGIGISSVMASVGYKIYIVVVYS